MASDKIPRNKNTSSRRRGNKNTTPIRLKHPQTARSTTQLTIIPGVGANQNLGTIALDENPYDKLLKGFPRDNDLQRISVRDINPEALRSLDRTTRLLLLKHLSETSVRISLQVNNKMLTGKANGKKVDLATLLILSVAQRGHSCGELVGELIGLSTPSTANLLAKYIQPPLVNSDMILPLVHATARHITQPRARNGDTIGRFQLFRHVPHIVASALSDLDEAKVDRLKRVVRDLGTKWKKADEMGIKVGLVLVGLKIQLRRAIDGNNLGLAKLLTKIVFGGLSAVPAAGPFFSATGPIAEKLIDRREEKKNKRFTKVWDMMWIAVQDAVDEIVPLNTKDGQKCYNTYEMWLNRVLAYESPSLEAT